MLQRSWGELDPMGSTKSVPKHSFDLYVGCMPVYPKKKRTTEGQEGKRIAENQDIQTT